MYRSIFGCLNPLYVQFNSEANTDDESCTDLKVDGCTDPLAANYNEAATDDDGSCIDIIEGCTIQGLPCFDPNANTLDASSCFDCPDLRSIRTRSDTIVYCSDELADNYNIFFDSSNDLWGNQSI